ncbi:hypothetical protein BH10PAT1_BH10PAT1_7820 [soil metagenome]
MKKIILTITKWQALLIFIFVFLFLIPKNALAIYDPTTVANNNFGIHVVDTNDLDDVAKLVNSNGGDWGYVTIVIQKGERDTKRWQQAFDQMRKLHLIPIVRIATAPIPGNDNVWEKPSVDEIDGWVSFLNSLNWVIKNRYVIIGNEPNHANEWGGQIDPNGYADYLKLISQKVKSSNEDFFIMPAGFDASANTSKNQLTKDATMDESVYLKKMFEKDPNVFEYVDGWSSHSYPNPAFSGPGNGIGKGTVSTFIWELNYLKLLGFQKDLPVFITETGWTHDTDILSTDIGPKMETAFNNVWSDKRVVAVTPFIYKYIDLPFDNFSWVNKDGLFYDFYNTVQNLPKISGEPIQNIKGDILTGILPKIAVTNSAYHGVLFVKNTGESIWKISNLGATDGKGNRLTIESMFPETVEPQQIGIFLVDGEFPNNAGQYEDNITLTNDNKFISNTFKESVNLIPKIPNLSEILDYLKITIARRLNF